MSILVTGARGSVGRTVVEKLLAAGESVRAASSQPGDTSLPAEVEVIGLDLTDPAAIDAALDGVDRVFLYAAEKGIDNFARAAKSAGIQRITLLSSIAAAEPGNPIGDRHLAAERPLQSADLPLTILRPGAFATNWRWWAPSIKSERVVRLPFPDVHQNSIHEADIADAAITALTEPGHEGHIYPLTGPESLSLRQMVDILATALGEPLHLEHITYAQASEFLYRPMLDLWSQLGDTPAPVGPTSESVTGRPARTFAQWATDHIADFK
ncbi:SDR family oxidoreductase [Nocardia blacklockiae]|uniref:SDR family oxidoreductase n=1 Tax=Nocardia blacklockiae TaxID=480036 RepID=UPI0018938D1C|nr:NAD(P)H-binding protein [Nocardia blacklockiae]MBF6173427.1 NAD(P)H-binding protein [Nocardia blacklockiae]